MKRKGNDIMTRLMVTFSMGLLATLLVIGHAESAKIVCVFPTASKSHVLGAQALLKELAHRGHEVRSCIPASTHFKLLIPFRISSAHTQ